MYNFWPHQRRKNLHNCQLVEQNDNFKNKKWKEKENKNYILRIFCTLFPNWSYWIHHSGLQSCTYIACLTDQNETPAKRECRWGSVKCSFTIIILINDNYKITCHITLSFQNKKKFSKVKSDSRSMCMLVVCGTNHYCNYNFLSPSPHPKKKKEIERKRKKERKKAQTKKTPHLTPVSINGCLKKDVK